MRKLFLALPLAALLALSPAPQSPAFAQAPAGRLAEAAGPVSLPPIGGTWSPAPRGAALLEGQALRTGPRATAELDLGPNRLGLEPDTVLRIDSAHPATPAFTLEQGRAVILLRSLRPGQVGRVHLPGGSVTLGEPGLYVVAAPGAGRPGSVGVSRGLAQLHGPGVSLAVPAGQTGVFGGPGPATLRQGVAEGFLADDPSPPPEIVRPAAQPAAPGLAGDDPLRREGSWAELPEYGTVWYPPVAPSWNPYADPWQAERWGYAPYTSGAWIMIGPRWAWMPPRRVPPPAWRHAHPPPGAARPHRPPPAVMAPDAAPAQIQRVQYQPASAVCDIVIRRTSNGALIEALVESDTWLDAEYSFDLDVSGGAGSSTISQGGEVTLDAGDTAVVAQNEISFNRNSRGRAELTVFDADGEVCSRTLRL